MILTLLILADSENRHLKVFLQKKIHLTPFPLSAIKREAVLLNKLLCFYLIKDVKYFRDSCNQIVHELKLNSLICIITHCLTLASLLIVTLINKRSSRNSVHLLWCTSVDEVIGTIFKIDNFKAG